LITPAPCCGKQQPVEKREAASKHKPCCCCSESAEQTPSPPKPEPKPRTPVKPCCCEKAPTVPSDLARIIPDLAAVALFVPVEPGLLESAVRTPSGSVFVDSSPPLHILHSVWLC